MADSMRADFVAQLFAEYRDPTDAMQWKRAKIRAVHDAENLMVGLLRAGLISEKDFEEGAPNG